MKRLDIYYLLALLLLALDISGASLIARGRPKTKKLEEQTREAPYVCLDTPDKLPACNFDPENDEETIGKTTSRQLKSLDSLSEPEDSFNFEESQNGHRRTTIIYKIEGCLPSRLPFVLPLCKTEDSVGRIVEVRRLFPFKMASPSTENSDALPPLVFPEVDMNEWNRFMQGPWIRRGDNDDKTSQSDKVTPPKGEHEESDPKKTIKHKKAGQPSFTSKKSNPQKFTEELSSKELDENDILSKFPSPAAMEKQLANDRLRDPDSYKARSTRLNRIVADVPRESNGEIVKQVVEKKPLSSLQHSYEFPYAKAIPYDPEKLMVARPRSELSHDEKNLKVSRLGSEFPYNRAISYDPEKLRIARLGNEFPYNRAISYNPKNLEVASVGSEFPYSRAISYNPKNLQVASVGSEFPYSRAISYNPKNLEVASVGSEFPYSRAIPYNPKNLQVASVGSEFPYSRAISYNPKNLEVASVGSEFPYSRAIPYNPKNLQVASVGSEFPYSRAISYNPKNLEVASVGSEFPYSRAIAYNPKNLQVASVGSEFPYSRAIPFDYTKLLLPKRGSEFPYNRAIRYNPENLRAAGAGSEFPYSRAIPFDPTKLYLPERDSEFPYSRAINYDPKNLRVAGVTNEFPYNRAIPFDAAKLYAPERGSEFPYNRAIQYNPENIRAASPGSEFPYSRAIPYDAEKLQVSKRGSEFPYSRAIPYDPKKLEDRKSAVLTDPLAGSSRTLKAAEPLTKSDNPAVVPFDTSMLDAAKKGGIFPYRKDVPDDTSKIVDTVEAPKTNVAKVPVRHVKTFWDELPTYAEQFSARKEETRLANFRAGRELEENIITSWDDEETSHNHGRFDSQKRFTRKATESEGSGDSSAANDSLEIPTRWSEFPYSKAIPYDPEKLRRTRSSSEYSESSIVVPHDFPYAKAVPYDSWKLADFRRKENQSQDEPTMPE